MPRRNTKRRIHPLAARFAAIAAIAIGACAGVVAAFAQDGAARTPAPARRAPSIRDSPGWYPVVDPESTSVLLGRRPNAPRVSKPFRGGTRSLDELGRAVCRALHRSDRDSLMALCIREDEFRDILWREFPQSRPITGLTWEDGWMSLTQRLIAGCAGAVSDHGGRYVEFLRFEADSVARYKNFNLHMGLRLVVRDDQGRLVRMHWLRSVAERKGRFKIYSTRD
jgi:hypothetical protein